MIRQGEEKRSNPDEGGDMIDTNPIRNKKKEDIKPTEAAPTDPQTVECAASKCPMESDWDMQDPIAIMSPYTEPEGALEGGFLAGLSIAAIIVLAAIFYMFYKSRMAAREKKIKEVFAKSIAAHYGIEKDAELTSVELEKSLSIPIQVV